MKINEFSESKSSKQDNSEVEEYPIEEFESYINQNKANFSKPESFYVDKINELQK
jgi:hypothetical protein